MTDTATLKQDHSAPDAYRVEAPDGEVAIFSGPNSLDRAIAFAGGGAYYSGWADPDGLAGY